MQMEVIQYLNVNICIKQPLNLNTQFYLCNYVINNSKQIYKVRETFYA